MKVLQRAFLQWYSDPIMRYLPNSIGSQDWPGPLTMYTPASTQNTDTSFVSATYL
jgi:hypothetical protein